MSAPKVEDYSPRAEALALAARLAANADNVLGTRHCLYRTDDLLSETGVVTTRNALGRALRRAGFAMVGEGLVCRTAAGDFRLWIIRPVSTEVRRSYAAAGRLYDEERA